MGTVANALSYTVLRNDNISCLVGKVRGNIPTGESLQLIHHHVEGFGEKLAAQEMCSMFSLQKGYTFPPVLIPPFPSLG